MHLFLKKVTSKPSVSLTNIRFISVRKGCPRISGLKVKGRRWQITSIKRKSLEMVNLLIGCVSSWKLMVCFLMLGLKLSRKSEYGIMMLLVGCQQSSIFMFSLCGSFVINTWSNAHYRCLVC
jgi:hypothetical protein